MRQPTEQDELHLLEEAELGDSEFMTEEEQVQSRRDRRQRKSSTIEMKKKRISSSDVSGVLDDVCVLTTIK